MKSIVSHVEIVRKIYKDAEEFLYEITTSELRREELEKYFGSVLN